MTILKTILVYWLVFSIAVTISQGWFSLITQDAIPKAVYIIAIALFIWVLLFAKINLIGVELTPLVDVIKEKLVK